jgi:uncharacterized protein (TIGR03435 family)
MSARYTLTASMLLSGLLSAALSAETQAPQTAAQATTQEPAFVVATIKPVEHDAKSGRYIVMQGPHRFVEKGYTLKLLIAAAYDLNPRTISGGPDWMESEYYDILALTPGDTQPNHAEQMAMLRGLLSDRFALGFHREQKDFSIYELGVAKGGAKLGSGLKQSAAAPSDPPQLISTVYPQKIVLPARNASMADFVSLLQRAVLDRPVVDKTGLEGRYDFDLEWAPDETQFGGDVPVAPSDAPSPPLFTAMQQELGLKLTATRGPVEALVVDRAQRPTAD